MFAKLEITFVDISTGKMSSTSEPVVLAPNGSSEYSPRAISRGAEQDIVVVARLYGTHSDNKLLSEAFSWPDP